MFVFLLANLPLPVIIFLNLQVTLKFLKVRHLLRRNRRRVHKPEQLILGWWLGNISSVFAFAPAVVERRIFVQNHWWLISYTIAATLSITGLILMNKGLGQEINVLSKRKHR